MPAEVTAQEAPFRWMVEGLDGLALFLLTAGGQIASWNRGAEQLTGYPESEVLGRPLAMLYALPATDGQSAANQAAIRGETEQRARRELARCQRDGRLLVEGWRRRRDGSRFRAEQRLTWLRDERRQMLGFGVVLFDRTAERQAEAEREQRLATLAQGLRVREEFLSIVAHELLTPLTPLELQVQRLQRMLARGGPTGDPGDLRERIATQVDSVLEQTARFDRLVHKLIELSATAAGRLILERSSVDLVELTRSTCLPIEPEAVRRGSRLLLDAPLPVRGSWDARRLAQVIDILVRNAVKYGAGQPVTISLRGEYETAKLIVSDRGPGMPRDLIDRVLGRNDSVAEPPSCGLGLYLTRQLVEAHGGMLWAESSPRGTTFVIELPREPVDATREMRPLQGMEDSLESSLSG